MHFAKLSRYMLPKRNQPKESAWFSGVSAVTIPAERKAKLALTPQKRPKKPAHKALTFPTTTSDLKVLKLGNREDRLEMAGHRLRAAT